MDHFFFLKQKDQTCLLQSLQMVLQDLDVLSVDDILNGMNRHVQKLKDQNCADPLYYVGNFSLTGPWKPTDIQRALADKYGAGNYIWKRFHIRTTGQFLSFDKNVAGKCFIVLGVPTSSKLKKKVRSFHKKRTAKALHSLSGTKKNAVLRRRCFSKQTFNRFSSTTTNLHAIGLRFDENRNGFLFDGMNRSVLPVTRLTLDLSLIRLCKCYEVKICL